jgi:hypothetical protein
LPAASAAISSGSTTSSSLYPRHQARRRDEGSSRHCCHRHLPQEGTARPTGIPERWPGDQRKNGRVTPRGTELCGTWWCVEKSFDRVITPARSGFRHLQVCLLPITQSYRQKSTKIGPI